MTATVIDGKASAAKLREKLAAATAALKAAHGLTPGLATVLVGNDPASEVYVRNKGKTAEALGFKSVHVALPADVSQEALHEKVRELNADKSVHGILVQLPLPRPLDENPMLDILDPAKDVDALTPINAGLLLSGRAHLVSCTPAGVMLLLKEYVGDISGKDVLVIGRSLLFGKPAAQLLLAANATVTMAHSRSKDLPAIARRADIVVAAIGKPGFVKADWIKPGAVVIDVGINRVATADGKSKVVGDVDYDAAKEVAGAITPVPGGVGAMTIVCLMQNTLIAACAQNGIALPNL
jgi:methylenetetrahydrofolate dehydrogenase (NADP+)/methenyltetrahydrofolate cyclohydrolase